MARGGLSRGATIAPMIAYCGQIACLNLQRVPDFMMIAACLRVDRGGILAVFNIDKR